MLASIDSPQGDHVERSPAITAMPTATTASRPCYSPRPTSRRVGVGVRRAAGRRVQPWVARPDPRGEQRVVGARLALAVGEVPARGPGLARPRPAGGSRRARRRRPTRRPSRGPGPSSTRSPRPRPRRSRRRRRRSTASPRPRTPPTPASTSPPGVASVAEPPERTDALVLGAHRHHHEAGAAGHVEPRDRRRSPRTRDT